MNSSFTFQYIGNMPFKKCAFCGTSLSVKYIATLDFRKHDCPRDSIVTPAKVYACNACVVRRKEG